MNIRLLRMATKDKRGVRRWAVPNQGNGVTLLPSHETWWNAPAVKWPAIDSKGCPCVRMVRLDWWLGIAKDEIRSLLNKTEV